MAQNESEPRIQNLPIGTGAIGKRIESDSMGEIAVAADHYWGAQTERSLHHFAIGTDRMPIEVCRAYGYVKKAAALVNGEFGLLPEWKANLIARVCDEIIRGELDAEFPLFVWQTGSGTQTNMNVNEVISNRAIQLADGKLGSKDPVHPNEHVNLSQSSNDTFPGAMHIATVLAFHEQLIPAVKALKDVIQSKAREWIDVVKLGRTHLQDATPLTVGQEWSGYAAQLEDSMAIIHDSISRLYPLAIGGTAVGTGLNAPPEFGTKVAEEIARMTGRPFVTARNKFAAQASLDPMVNASAALRMLAVALMKTANDLRWLGSGPRAGLHELILPENEPGSSIMPGKVNPTQQEAMVMVCIQVIANDTAVAFAGSQGNFELNAMRPIVIWNVLQSARLLTDACNRFREFGVEGITLDHERVQKYVNDSLMLVTALSPAIGYDKAAQIAHRAMEENLSLREAAVKSGFISAEDFDRIADPAKLVGNPRL
ncbi:class II fumarate hydratase [Occallatibacter riparius]|uniref:Fumarate hydratase class II n=1 Tax=Occallatibacter riparius TaxID=1002689 RepID=A0A9J7BMY9_9BACT|nr:class II fumarate hydratase [Occallatibacter riparius]UWZ82278.1 class II fumarate hydratase [Occallatibacter riparius]